MSLFTWIRKNILRRMAGGRHRADGLSTMEINSSSWAARAETRNVNFSEKYDTPDTSTVVVTEGRKDYVPAQLVSAEQDLAKTVTDFYEDPEGFESRFTGKVLETSYDGNSYIIFFV